MKRKTKKRIITAIILLILLLLWMMLVGGDKLFDSKFVTPAEKVKIVFEENGGTQVMSLSDVVTKVGYTFLGWYEEPDFSGPVITELPEVIPPEGVTLYAKWDKNAANIVFEENGGTEVKDLSGFYSEPISNRSMVSTKEGYTLDGWYETTDFSDIVVTQLPEFFTEKAATTYYAKWTENTLKAAEILPVENTVETLESYSVIQFNENGGSDMIDISGVAGEPVPDTTIQSCTKLGYSLNGWYEHVTQ